MTQVVKFGYICYHILSLLKLISSATDSTYHAAVVEYYPVQNSTLTGMERANANVDRYIELISQLGDQNLDIIVYPEATLTTGLRESRENIAEVATFVPEASESSLPCDNSSFPEYFRKLSCFAREMDSYIVVNLVEKEVCDDNTVPASGQCADDLLNFYNSDVVFHRSGVVKQRYRKYNLFGEYEMSVTPEVEVATFDTDFGVKFGLFTCFDILFEKPALLLVRQGVKHIAFPTMWFSELPFLSALQAQNMFAVENDVVFLAAGANSASKGSGGTGIYQGRLGPIEIDIIPNDGSKVYVADVQKEWNAPKKTQRQRATDDATIDKEAAALDNFYLKTDDLSYYHAYPLTEEVFDEVFTVSDQIKCRLSWKISYRNVTAQHYQYVFCYYSGVRSFDGVYNGGIDVCEVVFCQDYTEAGFKNRKCGERYSTYTDIEWPFTIEELTISGNFTVSTSSIQYPNTVLSNLKPLDVSDYEWSSEYHEDGAVVERKLSLLAPKTRLFTFGIYGRDFSRDSSAFWISGNAIIILTVLLLRGFFM